MRNIKLVLQYDGTFYHGFQTQADANLPTIQGEIERALSIITGEQIRVTGASRTDAGVHAHAQVLNFHTNSSVPSERFSFALNANLPQDIRVVNSAEVDPGFHARFDAIGKTYSYFIDTGIVPLVFTRNYAYHVPGELDEKVMQQAAYEFVGTHDFRAFAASGRSTKTSVRTITRADIKREKHLLEFVVEGNGFLYNMVRIMAGTLLEVGRGKMMVEEVRQALARGERDLAGPTAPAHGLHLREVKYQ